MDATEHFNHDLRDQYGRMLLCLCELGDKLRDLPAFLVVDEDVGQVIDAARRIIQEVDEIKNARIRDQVGGLGL